MYVTHVILYNHMISLLEKEVHLLSCGIGTWTFLGLFGDTTIDVRDKEMSLSIWFHRSNGSPNIKVLALVTLRKVYMELDEIALYCHCH